MIRNSTAEIKRPSQNRLSKDLKAINSSLILEWSDHYKKAISIYWLDKNNDRCLIYDFESQRYNFYCIIRFLATKEMDELQELVKGYLLTLEIEQDFKTKKNKEQQSIPKIYRSFS